MTFTSRGALSQFSRTILNTIITIFVGLFLFVFPVNAKTTGANSLIEATDTILLAQVQVCKPPLVLVNGTCRRKRIKINKLGKICPRNQVLVNGKCRLRRAAPQIRKPINTIRRCLPPKKMINGRCTQPNSVFKSGQTCLPPSKIINGRCLLPFPEKKQLTCGTPYKLVNGRCTVIGVIPECTPPLIRIKGICTRVKLQKLCPPPKKMVGGRCIRVNANLRPICIPPKKIVNGKCRLPLGQINPAACNPPLVRIGGVCKFPNLGNLCIPPKKMIGGVCKLPAQFVCPPPRVRRGALCVLPNPSCQLPFVRSPFTNRCYLPFVVDVIPEAECRYPWYYSERAGGCVKPRPRPRSQENIAWIQSCLNTLGYRAGVEDGISGRKTRSAWEDFRRALGLRGFANFNDPETLGILYRECSPKTTDREPPRTEPKPELEPTASSGEFDYRQSMCATGKLYSLLNGVYGDTVKLEQCGNSCLPVPEGMNETDLLRLQSEQGIRWCKDCVKVGDEGIICPAPQQ